MTTPLIPAAVASKIKNSQSAQVPSNISKSLRDKILSLTDMHGNGLGLKVV